MSGDTDTLITQRGSDDGPVHKNGIWKNVLRGRSVRCGTVWPRRLPPSADWQAFQHGILPSTETSIIPQDDEDTMSTRSSLDSYCTYDAEEAGDSDHGLLEEMDQQSDRTDRSKLKKIAKKLVLKFMMALPSCLIELAKSNQVINDLKRRLVFAYCRVRQHESKFRTILSKLAQLDSDVYDLQDPDDVQLLHKNWKKLYDEIEAWLGGPEAAMTSDSSDAESDSEIDHTTM